MSQEDTGGARAALGVDLRIRRRGRSSSRIRIPGQGGAGFPSRDRRTRGALTRRAETHRRPQRDARRIRAEIAGQQGRNRLAAHGAARSMTKGLRRRAPSSKLDVVVAEISGASHKLVTHPRIAELYPEYLFMCHGIVRATIPLMEAGLRQARLSAEERVGVGRARRLPGAAHRRKRPARTSGSSRDLEELGERSGSRSRASSLAHGGGARRRPVLLDRHYHPVCLLGYLAALEGYPPTRELIDDLIASTGHARAPSGRWSPMPSSIRPQGRARRAAGPPGADPRAVAAPRPERDLQRAHARACHRRGHRGRKVGARSGSSDSPSTPDCDAGPAFGRVSQDERVHAGPQEAVDGWPGVSTIGSLSLKLVFRTHRDACEALEFLDQPAVKSGFASRVTVCGRPVPST